MIFEQFAQKIKSNESLEARTILSELQECIDKGIPYFTQFADAFIKRYGEKKGLPILRKLCMAVDNNNHFQYERKNRTIEEMYAGKAMIMFKNYFSDLDELKINQPRC